MNSVHAALCFWEIVTTVFVNQDFNVLELYSIHKGWETLPYKVFNKWYK